MDRLDRRHFLLASAAGTAGLAVPAQGAPLSHYGLDAAQFGARPGAPEDQSLKLQRALDQAARTRVPLVLAPGIYRAGDLHLPAGAQLLGVRGATQLVRTHGPSLLSAEHADTVTVSGLILDGGGQRLPEGRALLHLDDVKALRIADCDIRRAGGNAITLEGCDGAVNGTTIADAADAGLYANNSRGLVVSGNVVRGSGNNGILIWQSDKRADGSIVSDNRIEDTRARSGGDGQNGNAINVFRAGNVVVRGNVIRRAAFSAIRGNSASNIQIVANNCTALDEVALYSEFGFEGAVIVDNIVDGAETGISVTNFNEGGRLASVHGNVVRNLAPRRPGTRAEACTGVGVEADTAVTGNTIEGATGAGIRAGYGQYLRNVAITGNVVRNAGAGVEVSVAGGAGAAAVTGNVIAGARRGAIVGMEWEKQVTGDLAEDAARYPQLTIANNRTL
jgi:uncharacterized secreted repeat protein (TIGR03808 family)